jgi:hypothetical protein
MLKLISTCHKCNLETEMISISNREEIGDIALEAKRGARWVCLCRECREMYDSEIKNERTRHSNTIGGINNKYGISEWVEF